ncbi:MAG TPA: hypothetical protein VNT01_07345 [Symbiobacteriaceae bacterium]|nr:hypothetical protein [Symbiobacteriaceae bacterium]
MNRWFMPTRLIAAFSIGFACALWLFPLLAGPTIQDLRLQRDEARGRVDTLETEVQKLQESLKNRQGRLVVKLITVQVEGPDERVILEAERRLKKQLTEQYAGRALDDISAFLLNRRLQGLILEIDGIRYQFSVELVVVGPELAVYGVLHPVKGGH